MTRFLMLTFLLVSAVTVAGWMSADEPGDTTRPLTSQTALGSGSSAPSAAGGACCGQAAESLAAASTTGAQGACSAAGCSPGGCCGKEPGCCSAKVEAKPASLSQEAGGCPGGVCPATGQTAASACCRDTAAGGCCGNKPACCGETAGCGAKGDASVAAEDRSEATFQLVSAAAEGSDTRNKKEKGPELFCPVTNKPAKKSVFAEYKGGKVYFCCAGCNGKFAKHTEKFATKANYQLVASGQAKQKACPLSGNKCNPQVTSKVGDVKVAYCCEKCKSKVGKASAEQRLAMVFSDAAFEKAFEIKKEKKKEEKSS